VGDRPGAADTASEEYVALLLRELKATTSNGGGIDPARIRAAGGLTSIFFGGGTPSLTPPRLVKGVIEGLERAFGLSAEGCEVRIALGIALLGFTYEQTARHTNPTRYNPKTQT